MKYRCKRLILVISCFLFIFSFVDASTTRYISCGVQTGIPYDLPGVTRSIITIIQIAVPILLIIMGSVDLLKVVFSSENDELGKSVRKLIFRFIGAVAIFFVILIVKLVLQQTSYYTNTTLECITCFTSDKGYCYEYEVENADYTSEKEAADKAREELAARREEARKNNAEKAEEERKKNENNNKNNNNGNSTVTLTGGTYSEQAFNYLVAKGWTKQAAAGAIGNMFQETNCGGSDINPWAIDAYGNGGIVGWTDNSVATNMTQFKNYASSVGDPWPKTSLKTQLDFLIIHLSSNWTGAYATPTFNGLNNHGYSVSHVSYTQFTQGTSVRDATLQFLSFYEDCGYEYSNVDYRIQMAESVYKSYS